MNEIMGPFFWATFKCEITNSSLPCYLNKYNRERVLLYLKSRSDLHSGRGDSVPFDLTLVVTTVSVSQVDRPLWSVYISISLQPLLLIIWAVWNLSPLICSLGVMWIFFFYFLFFILMLSSFLQNSISKLHSGATNCYSNVGLLCLTWHCTNSRCHQGTC